jgi:hypothetical protein
MRVAAKRNVVCNFAPFKDLTMHGGEEGNRAILELIDELQTKLYDEGSCVVCEGESGFEVYFITYGFVTVSTKEIGEMNKLRKGAVFGESVLFSEKPPLRFATIRSSCSFLELEVLHKDSFHYLEERHPVFYSIARALRHTHSRRTARSFDSSQKAPPGLSLRSIATGAYGMGDLASVVTARLKQSSRPSYDEDQANPNAKKAASPPKETVDDHSSSEGSAASKWRADAGGATHSRAEERGEPERRGSGFRTDEEDKEDIKTEQTQPKRHGASKRKSRSKGREQRVVDGAAGAHPLPMGALASRLSDSDMRNGNSTPRRGLLDQ